jgi:hypothetical protein
MGKGMFQIYKFKCILVIFILIVCVFLTNNNVHFSQKVEAAKIYLWDKYTIKSQLQWDKRFVRDLGYYYTPTEYYYHVNVNPVTGVLTYVKDYYDGEFIYPISSTTFGKTGYWCVEWEPYYDGYTCVRQEYFHQLWETYQKPVDVRGDYVSTVSSINSGQYPSNGKYSDGYWYVYKGTTNEPTINLTTSNNPTLNLDNGRKKEESGTIFRRLI